MYLQNSGAAVYQDSMQIEQFLHFRLRLHRLGYQFEPHPVPKLLRNLIYQEDHADEKEDQCL